MLESSTIGPTARLKQLVALSAFAVAQPLLGLVESHPGFLVAHRVTPGDILLLVVGLFAAVPIFLFAIEAAVGWASRAVETLLHQLFVAGLCTLFTVMILNRFVPETGAATLVAAALPGLVLAACLTRMPRLSRSLAFMSLAPLLFLAAFLAHEDIRALLRQDRDPAIEPPEVSRPAPAVVVIFDELPLTSLLDAEGRIDGIRYPSFAKLAGSSTWFRNATSVTDYTQQAVTAILTGRYPGIRPRLAVASEHPRNLFSLLAGSHDLNVVESQMQLGHPDILPRPRLRQRVQAIVEDLYVLYLHMILPDTLATGLPKVTETWRGFGAGRFVPPELGGTDTSIRVNHPAEFRDFVASIEAPEPGQPPALHFIHSVIPHRPWQYLPSGSVYFPYRQHGVGAKFATLSGDWWQQEAYQRHLLQVAYVDRLLGELLDRLEELGLFDESLIVVTSDHGVGFWPDDNARIIHLSAHPEDILSVPLFVKRPGQLEGEVDRENAETIDILPTLAQLLGARVAASRDAEAAWEFDGCALFDPACRRRPLKRAYSSAEPRPRRMKELRFDPELGLGNTGLNRKQAFFGEGLYRFGPYGSLVGKRLDSLSVEAQAAGSVALETGPRPGYHDPDERRVPVRISGRLELGSRRPTGLHVAVVAAGEIQTVVPAMADAGRVLRVLAMLPEPALESGDRPGLYLVEGPPEQPLLLPLEVR